MSLKGDDRVIIDDTGGGSTTGTSKTNTANWQTKSEPKSDSKATRKATPRASADLPKSAPIQEKASFDPKENPTAKLQPKLINQPFRNLLPLGGGASKLENVQKFTGHMDARHVGSGRTLDAPIKKGDAGGIVTIGDMAEGNAWSRPATSVSELRHRTVQVENPFATLFGNSFAGGVVKSGAEFTGVGGTLAKGASLKQNVQHAGSKAAHNNKSPQMAAQKTESEKDQPFSAAKSSLKM